MTPEPPHGDAHQPPKQTSDSAGPPTGTADAAEAHSGPAIADLGIAALTAMVRLMARQAAREAMRAVPAITAYME